LASRNEKDLGRKFPVVKGSIAALDVRDAFVDGEIVALDEKGRPSFQALQGFDMGQWPLIVFYAFDLLQLNGKDLRNLPIEERKVKLEELHLKVLLANEVDPDMRPESAPEQWVKIKSIKNKNSSSADKSTPKEGGNILAPCWLASMKGRNSNLPAGLEPVSAKSFCILSSQS
jgi:hypothetical protein